MIFPQAPDLLDHPLRRNVRLSLDSTECAIPFLNRHAANGLDLVLPTGHTSPPYVARASRVCGISDRRNNPGPGTQLPYFGTYL